MAADPQTPSSASPTSSNHPQHTAPVGPDPVYPAEFYEAFQPQTALDMLNRTPGFTLSSGNEVRGFGGAAGNVLIDGQRPTVKSGGISEVLRRIPATQVERIVLLRGSDAAEAQGQVLVANVILRADATGSGNASLSLSHTADGHISPAGQLSYARRIGAWQANVALTAETVRYPTNGTYYTRDAAGALLQTRVEQIAASAPELGLAASASRPLAGGTLTLNTRLNRDIYRSDHSIDLYSGEAIGSPGAVRTIAYAERGWSGEFGADWTRGVGRGWTTKLVGLGRIEHGNSTEDYAEPGYRGLSRQDQKPIELVSRATLTREGNHALRPELGMELAWNRLKSTLDYAEDYGSGLTPVLLSNADTSVSELRGEAFVNLNIRLSKTLNLESGTAFELSQIRVTGDAASSQSLSYWKPSAALVWALSGKTQLRLGARRSVDQLNFGDFAASVDQADGRPLGGNSGLRPARITRALARIDHRWGDGGALALEAFHQWHDGLLGYLLLPTGDEALGTIGNARQWGITGNASLPLNTVLPGARLTLDGTLRDSRLPDPITGSFRPMDDLSPRVFSAEFRHDLPDLKLSWGITLTAAQQAEYYYIGEVLASRDRATFGAYLETTALAGFKATLKADTINGAYQHRLRRFYAPTRAGSFTGSEERHQRQGAVLSVTLARQI